LLTNKKQSEFVTEIFIDNFKTILDSLSTKVPSAPIAKKENTSKKALTLSASSSGSTTDKSELNQFGLKNEVIIAEYEQCFYEGKFKFTFPGTLYITSSGIVAFSGKVFARKKKIVIQKITNVVLDKTFVSISGINNDVFKFTVPNAQNLEHLFQSLRAFLKTPSNTDSTGRKSIVVGVPSDNVKRSSSISYTASDETETDWDSLLSGAVSLTVKPGTVIIKEGEVSRKIFYIQSGVCSVKKNNVTLTSLYESDTFGAISFFKRDSATASVIATEDTVVYVIDGNFVDQMLTTQPKIVGSFYKYLCFQLVKRLREVS